MTSALEIEVILTKLGKGSKSDIEEELAILNGTLKEIDEAVAYRNIVAVKRDHLLQELTKKVLEQRNFKTEGYDELISIAQAAKKLECSAPTVYNKHIPAGLKTVRPTGEKGHLKVKLSDFYEYMEKIG